MYSRILLVCLAAATAGAANLEKYDYRILEIRKVSEMEKEMNEAAADGYSFQALLGREDEKLVIVMEKAPVGTSHAKTTYKLLAASRASSMQEQLQDAAEAGFRLLSITVADTSFWRNKDLISILSKEE